MRVEIELNGNKEIEELIRTLPKEGKAASGKAVKAALAEAKRASTGAVTSVYTVKQRNVSRTAKSLYRSSSSEGRLIFRGPRLGMREFELRPSSVKARARSGLYLRVRKDGGGRLPHHFLADINGVKAFIRKGRERFPIARGLSPSVPAMVKNPEVTAGIKEAAVRTYEEIFRDEFARRLGDG